MINKAIRESQEVMGSISQEPVIKATALAIEALKSGHKILLCGNGGSAEMSSHIAAEFTGRYKLERKALAAIALTTDIAALTAIGNDYGFDRIFERQIEALGKEGDVLIVLTTSGNSPNLIKAVEKARSIGIKTIGLLGKDGGKLKNKTDVEILIASDNTPRIQEAHLFVLHNLCEEVEKQLTK